MSFDELPPEAEDARELQSEITASEQETSAQDAPPNPLSDEKSGEGSDAASSTQDEPTITKPRQTRSRRQTEQTSQQNSNETTPQASDTENTLNLSADDTLQHRSPKRVRHAPRTTDDATAGSSTPSDSSTLPPITTPPYRRRIAKKPGSAITENDVTTPPSDVTIVPIVEKLAHFELPSTLASFNDPLVLSPEPDSTPSDSAPETVSPQDEATIIQSMPLIADTDLHAMQEAPPLAEPEAVSTPEEPSESLEPVASSVEEITAEIMELLPPSTDPVVIAEVEVPPTQNESEEASPQSSEPFVEPSVEDMGSHTPVLIISEFIEPETGNELDVVNLAPQASAEVAEAIIAVETPTEVAELAPTNEAEPPTEQIVEEVVATGEILPTEPTGEEVVQVGEVEPVQVVTVEPVAEVELVQVVTAEPVAEAEPIQAESAEPVVEAVIESVEAAQDDAIEAKGDTTPQTEENWDFVGDPFADDDALPQETLPIEEATSTPTLTRIEPADDAYARGRRGRNDRRNRRSSSTWRDGGREEAPPPKAGIPSEPPAPIALVQKRCQVVNAANCPSIHINGKSFPPIFFFGNLQDPKNPQKVLSEVRRAAKAGIHLHSTLIDLPCPLSEVTDALDNIDTQLRQILDADPQGFLLPRIVFVPAKGWKREYPTDISTYTTGASGDPCYTSDRFWREARYSLETLISHLQEYEWGNRIFGYHLERGEWFHPVDMGYDRCMANREAFRDWLREKYNNNLVALRAAWFDGNVQFHTAEIPPTPAKPNPIHAFYDARRERRIIDFNEFTSQSIATRLCDLAGTIKTATDHQVLVSVCYGYTLEFGHGFSGHLALNRLLKCENIDILSGPPSYRDRKPGGGASLPSPVDAIALQGKLWISEDDTKTHLSPAQQPADDFNPRLHDRYQTEQAHTRALGRAISTGTGINFMDLWGEGWLDEDAIWERIQSAVNLYPKHQNETKTPPFDLVALIDEESLFHIQRGEPFFRKLTNGFRDTLQRVGARHGLFLQKDILNPDFPTDAKVYLFLTPYRLTNEIRAAIQQKLHGGNRTLVWLYAPASCEERAVKTGLEEYATATIGIPLRMLEWNSEFGSRIVDTRHPITEKLGNRDYGSRERLNPGYYVDDSAATVLAEYASSGLPSIALKKCEGWNSLFVGEPHLSLELLRGICRFAKVPLWTGGGDDVLFIGNGLVTIHANRDGNRTLRFPDPVALYDLADRKLIGTELREHRYFLRNGATRIFCYGSLESLRSLELPNLVEVVEPPLFPTIAPLVVAEEAPQPLPMAPNLPPDVPHTDDIATLQAVLTLDVSQIDDLPMEDMDTFALYQTPERPTPGVEELDISSIMNDMDSLSGGKRRRRRGGRGRGKRQEDELAEDLAEEFPPTPTTFDIPGEPKGLSIPTPIVPTILPPTDPDYYDSLSYLSGLDEPPLTGASLMWDPAPLPPPPVQPPLEPNPFSPIPLGSVSEDYLSIDGLPSIDDDLGALPPIPWDIPEPPK